MRGEKGTDNRDPMRLEKASEFLLLLEMMPSSETKPNLKVCICEALDEAMKQTYKEKEKKRLEQNGVA